CRRFDALSRLQPPLRRLGAEQIWRERKSRSDRVLAPLQHRTVRPLPAGHHRRRGIHLMAAGVAPGRVRRPRLRLQMEYGLDARHAEIYRQGPDTTQITPRRHIVLTSLPLLREFHPAAVP